MLTLDELRQQYPSFKQFSDEELLSRVAKAVQMPLEDVAKDFGFSDPANAPRGVLGAANDTVVNFGNAAIGGVKAAIDFVSPGTRASEALQGVMDSGNRTKSLSTRIADERLGAALNTDDVGTQLSGVKDYVLENPLQAAAMATGSFVGPGAAIKGVRGIAAMSGASKAGISTAGTGAAMTTGAMMAGGDAAGNAYDMVLERGGSEEDARRAAREASAVPALVGAIGGRFGAEGALARGGTSSILKTGAQEFGINALEEGVVQGSANVAAGQYVDGINPMTGVVGSAALGGVLGGGTGLAVGALTRQRPMLQGSNLGQDEKSQDSGGGIGAAIQNHADPSGQMYLLNSDEMDVGGKPINPYDRAGYVSAFQNNADTTLGESSGSLFAPNPVSQPNIDSGAIAAQNAQANQQQQAVQQQQSFDEGLKLYGITPLAGRQNQFSFGGKPLFSPEQATQFMQGVEKAAAEAGLTPEQIPMIGALVGSNAVKFTAKTTPQQAVNSVKKFMDTYGLQDAPSVQEIADRLNTQIELAEGNSGLKIASQLNDVFVRLAGANAPAFDALTAAIDGNGQTQPAVKKTAAVPAAQAPSAVTSIPVDQYNAQQGANDGSQLQTTPRVGAVSAQGSQGTGGAGEVSNLLQSDGLELVGTGSQSAGSTGQQTDGAGKKRTRYVAPAKSDDVSGNSDTAQKTPEVKTDQAVRQDSSIDEDVLDDGDAPLSRMEKAEDGLSLEDLGISEDGESDLGFRTFNPDERGEAQAGDVASTNRSLGVFRKAVAAKKLGGVEDYVLNNVYLDEKATDAERAAVVKELERRAAVTAAKGKKKSKGKDEDTVDTGEDEYLTDREAAERAWDKHASKIPGAPLFAELEADFQDTFIEFGSDNWKRSDVVGLIEKAEPQMSKSEAKGGSNAQDIRDEITAFIGTENRQKLVVLQSVNDFPKFLRLLVEASGEKLTNKTQAVVIAKRAFLFADNIAPGKARAVFLHEIGGHLGLQELLGDGEFTRLIDQVIAWSEKADGSLENKLAVAAMERVDAAGTAPESRNNELVAYFLEEAINAGVNPTASKFKTGVASWVKAIRTAMIKALDKLGFKNMNLTAQDMVDMAFGAARVTMMDNQVPQKTAKKEPVAQFSKSASLDNLRKGAPEAIASLPKPYQGAAQTIFDTIKNFAKEGLVRAAFTEDLVRMARDLVPSAKKWWALTRERSAIKTKFERRVEEVLQEYDRLDASVKGTGVNSVNKFLKDSTMDNKWGFKPSWMDNAKIDPAMKARFDAMPASAQDVIKRVFEYGHETLVEMKKGVMDNITTEYDALIAAAKTDGDAKELATLQKKKAQSLRDYQSLMNIQADKPYAPLKRFGNHVVVGRSQAYLDAEDVLKDPKATEDQRAEARKSLREYQNDESHYFVQFAETRAEAAKIAKDQEKDYGLVQNFKKDDVRESLYGGRDMQGLFYRLRNLVSQSVESNNLSAGEKAINRLVNDLHLSMLSEQSARQSERRRKKIAGADDDMMRAFATQGRATAHFISTLQNTGGIYESLQGMKNEADARTPGREERRQYYNEFLKRHAMGLDYEPHPIIDRAMGTTSVWMLLTNPAYYLQNATQPWMMTLPTLAGKHGYGRAQSEMFKAYRELMGVIRKEGLSEASYSKLPADVRNAVERLVNAGRIDISLDQDLGRWRSAEERNAASFAIEKLRGVAQDVESINRVVSAVAAYRLEKQRGVSEDAAIAYADKVIYDTHGDYSGANAPRITRAGIGRMATQFRKFQLIQLSLMTKLTHQAFKGASPEERAIGRRALGFTLTHLFATTGLVGLPGFSAIAWALGAAFGDDDEPNNPEVKLRKMIGDNAVADLLLKGVPKLAGVDLSGKIGAGNMLSIMPYTDVDFSRDGYARAAVGMLGPFAGGLMPKVADGIGLMAGGDYYKGLAAIAPSGLANALKAADYMDRGVTRRNGDVVLAAEDISFLDATMTALGLPTGTITDSQFINRTQGEFERFYQERSTDIRKGYVEAYKKGDSESMEQARQDWSDMQDSRRKNGFKVQPLSELFKAPIQQRKRETEYQKTLKTSGAQAAGMQR